MFRHAIICLLFSGLSSASLLSPAEAEPFKRHHERILGTSLDLVIMAPTASDADAAEAAALDEIERLDRVFSLYRASELTALNAKASSSVSIDMLTVLSQCETYMDETGNAFSCRIGSLLKTWAEAEASGVAPDRPSLRIMAGQIKRANVRLDDSAGTVERPSSVLFDLNALAKGYVLDAALEAARQASPDISGMLVNIGGDIRTWGEGPDAGKWRIAVTSSSQIGDGATAPGQMMLIDEGAVATSAQGLRDREIGGQFFGHVLSPADGWPVEEVFSASVYAPEALDADALAPALMVMGIKDGLDCIETRDGVEAEIVTYDGRRHVSSGWSQFSTGETSPISDPEADKYSFEIDFEIPSKSVAAYERPYVAVWIADERRNLVRVLMLAGDESRWMEENYYWYRRFARKAGSLVDAVAGPTRRPGEYELEWDRLDDDGAPVPNGNYVLHIEASREHGGHQHESLAFSLADEPFTLTAEAGEELGETTVSFAVK